MPQKYKLNHKPCPTKYEDKLLNPMCRLPAKDFEPHNKPHKPHPSPNKPPSPPHNPIRQKPSPTPFVPISGGSTPGTGPVQAPGIGLITAPPITTRGVPLRRQQNYFDQHTSGGGQGVFSAAEISAMPEELRQQAELINLAYLTRKVYDVQMQESYDESVLDGLTDPNEVFSDPLEHKVATQTALQELEKEINDPDAMGSLGMEDGRYTVDFENSIPDSLILVDNETGKVNIVLHGASSGAENTVTGEQVNTLDQSSFINAINPLSKDKTAELYPELDPQMESLIDTYGHDRLQTISYSNGAIKQSFINQEWKIPGTAFDGVIQRTEMARIRQGLPAEIHYVRTNKFSLGMDSGKLTDPTRFFHDPIGQTNPELNVRVTTIEPLKLPKGTTVLGETGHLHDAWRGGHSIDQFKTRGDVSDGVRGTSPLDNVRSVGSLVTGVVVQAGIQKGIEAATGNKDLTTPLTGAAVETLPVAANTLGNVVAAEGVAAKMESLVRGVGAVASAAPAGAASFEAATITFDATQKLFKALNINRENANIGSTAASMGVGKVTLDVGNAVVKAGKGAAGRAVGRLGAKVENTLGRRAADEVATRLAEVGGERLAVKAGIKVLSAGLKASEVGAVLGEGIDIVIDSWSLIDATSKGRYVSSDEIGDTARNILNPFAFIDDIGNIDTKNQVVNTSLNLGANTVNSTNAVVPFKFIGDIGSAIIQSIAHAKGAHNNQERGKIYASAVQKLYKTLDDQTMNYQQYQNIDTAWNQLTDEERSLINQLNPKFRTTLEETNHKRWQTFSTMTQNRINLVNKIQEHVILNDDDQTLLTEIRKTDPSFYDTIRNQQQKAYNQQIRLGLSENDYTSFVKGVNSGADASQLYGEILKDAAHDAGYLNINNYLSDKESKSTTALKAEASQMNLTVEEHTQLVKSTSGIHDNSHDINVLYLEMLHAKNKLGLDQTSYMELQDRVAKGESIASAYNLAKQTNSFDRVETYVNDNEPNLPQQFVSAFNNARSHGFYTANEEYYNDDMQKWTPQNSALLSIHQMGITYQQYADFMNAMNSHSDIHQYTPKQLAEQNRLDYAHFQDDLHRAGYNISDYDENWQKQSVNSSSQNDQDKLDAIEKMKQEEDWIPEVGQHLESQNLDISPADIENHVYVNNAAAA